MIPLYNILEMEKIIKTGNKLVMTEDKVGVGQGEVGHDY